MAASLTEGSRSFTRYLRRGREVPYSQCEATVLYARRMRHSVEPDLDHIGDDQALLVHATSQQRVGRRGLLEYHEAFGIGRRGSQPGPVRRLLEIAHVEVGRHAVDMPDAERIGGPEQAYASLVSAQPAFEAGARIARHHETHAGLGRRGSVIRFPALGQLTAPDDAQLAALVEKTLRVHRGDEARCHHHRHVGRFRQLADGAIGRSRRRQHRRGHLGCEQHLEQPLVQVGKQVGAPANSRTGHGLRRRYRLIRRHRLQARAAKIPRASRRGDANRTSAA